ncbi:MAG: M20/M25/M40 family metallo-hydrolase, partial [Chitinophagaceae bacterium]|nr:M20/M25/M40 family metallo-hydrolase [Chitinophagaceae bacterium]
PQYNSNGIVHVQAPNSFKLTTPIGIPRVAMSYEDGQRIARLIKSGIDVELALTLKGRFSTADTKGYNVIAEIPGTDPDLKSQVVMLGGHLDSWQASTGATDNGAGCAVVMEVARLFIALGLKPKRTIRLALWDGEEQGLYGSYNYVKKHFTNADGTPNEAQKNVSAYFNLDYGTGKIRGIYSQDNAAIKPIFEQWLVPFHDLGAKTVSINGTGSTDHSSFEWAGIPGFQFIQDVLDDRRTHHTNLDDFDHLAIDDMKQSVIILASFVYQASMRPELLPRKPWVKGQFVFDGM